MAKIWLAQGKRKFRRIGPLAERSLSFCVKKLGLTTRDWKAMLGFSLHYLSGQDKFDSHGATGTVIVEVDNSDLVGFMGWKAGYYIVALQVEDVARKLKSEFYAYPNARSGTRGLPG